MSAERVLVLVILIIFALILLRVAVGEPVL